MVEKTDYQFRVRAHTLLGEGNPVWQDSQEFIAAFNEVEDKTIVSPFRCFTLYQLAKQCNAIEGSFAQVGVYRGGSARLIAGVKDPKKKMYLFDTFEGLPEHDPKIDLYQQGKFADTSLEEVTSLFAEVPNVQIYPGFFPDTTTHIPEEERFALVYLDVDLYKSNFLDK